MKVVGDIPRSQPPLTVPVIDLGLWQQLLVSALLLSVIGFVEPVSVAQTLAAKSRAHGGYIGEGPPRRAPHWRGAG